jgi:4-hydroxy-tetrahydrodipicolinate synthase
MNAVGNLAPSRVSALCEAVFRGDLAGARRLHDDLFALNQAIFLDTNPIPLKYMMWRVGLVAAPEVRLPLVPMDAERGRKLDEVLRRSGLLQTAVA